MSTIRLLRPDDVPAVAALRQRVFTRSRLTGSALEQRIERLFLLNPWYRDDVGSLVHVAADGQVNGFLGLVPRPMRRGSRMLDGLMSSQFMVAPEARAIAGVRLFRAACDRPVDVLFTDTATADATQLWELLGGAAALVYGTMWTIPLRRAEYAAQRWGASLPARAARALGRPLLRGIDRARSLRNERRYTTRAASAADLVTHVDEFAGDRLRPVYDDTAFEFILGVLRERWGDELHAMTVHADAEVIGCFVYRSGSAALLYQLHAKRGKEDDVVAAAADHAASHGAVVLEGRFDRQLMTAVKRLGGSTEYNGRGVLTRTRDTTLLQDVLSGAARLSGLDGEWWMGFGD